MGQRCRPQSFGEVQRCNPLCFLLTAAQYCCSWPSLTDQLFRKFKDSLGINLRAVIIEELNFLNWDFFFPGFPEKHAGIIIEGGADSGYHVLVLVHANTRVRCRRCCTRYCCIPGTRDTHTAAQQVDLQLNKYRTYKMPCKVPVLLLITAPVVVQRARHPNNKTQKLGQMRDAPSQQP